MSDLHINDFYRDTALILLRLYATFPNKVILYVDDIVGPNEPDEFGLPSDRFMAGFSTMVWLGEQGYLQYDSPIRQEALDQTVLSHKGFVLLSSRSEMPLGEEFEEQLLPPLVMEESQTNVAHLKRALKSGSSLLIRQCVHQLLRTLP